MVYNETAYIRRYKKTVKKTNRIIESVEVRGLNKKSKFKDKQDIIILTVEDFNNLNNELETLKANNNNLMQELNNNEYRPNHETSQLYNKLFDLMEVVNNRNELLINANDNLNIMVDAIIKELQGQYINLIDAHNKENKRELETLIKSIVNNANTSQERQKNLINNEIDNIELELKEANQQLNNMSILQFIRKRKQININVDLSNLKDVPSKLINDNDLNNKIAIDNILSIPNFNNVNHGNIKENAKKEINFNDLYIKLDSKEI